MNRLPRTRLSEKIYLALTILLGLVLIIGFCPAISVASVALKPFQESEQGDDDPDASKGKKDKSDDEEDDGEADSESDEDEDDEESGAKKKKKKPKLPEPAEPTGDEGTEPGDTILGIEGEDVDGESFELGDYEGKVIMLDFWGDW